MRSSSVKSLWNDNPTCVTGGEQIIAILLALMFDGRTDCHSTGNISAISVCQLAFVSLQNHAV